MSFSPDELKLISATFDGIKIWNLETGKVEGNFSENLCKFHIVEFSPDGKRFAVGSNNSKIYIFNSETCKIEK